MVRLKDTKLGYLKVVLLVDWMVGWKDRLMVVGMVVLLVWWEYLLAENLVASLEPS